jgi:EmrB/QacA subfamily drug resistance transporter
VVFLIGSALSGLSQTMEQLIIFRGLQGLGAGALFPISLAVIGDLFSPRERGRYQGLFGAVFGISALIGPALGGFLTDNFSWHWVFYVNIPIGLVALAIIWRLLPMFRPQGVTRSVDYLGVAVFTGALVPILIGLTNKQTLDWTDPWVGGLLALGLILTGVFIWVESRAKEPIVPLHLFRNRTFSISMTATFLAAFGFFGAILFLPLWYQVVQGSSAAGSGYQLLPLLAGLILSSIVSGQIVSRTGRYKWMTVIALVTLGFGLWLMTHLQADTPAPMLWVWQFITGLGVGPTFAVFTIIVQNAVSYQELGVATSNLTFFRQVGGVVGLAITGTIFGSTFSEQVPIRVTTDLQKANAPQQLLDQLAANLSLGGGSVNQLASVGDLGAKILASIKAQGGDQAAAFVQPYIGYIVQGIHEALSIAIANSLWLGMFAALIAAGATAFLREAPLRREHSADNPAAIKAEPVAEF